MIKSDLIIIDTAKLDVILDVKYATNDNFVGTQIYQKPVVMLHINAYQALEKAVESASRMGYKLKIFDGFRPFEAQKLMYDAFPGSNYVSDPDNGIATHTRGIAIDLTLVDQNNNELDMGTAFDSFEESAHHTSFEVRDEVLKNRMLLLGIMTFAGFEFYKYEWWHYQLPNPYDYPKLHDNDAPISIM
ncbi:MAG: D-alanyl-D-alanine dipeptidase [Alphaproteobacteria bacterium]|nr:D-alanyl-D-alanine dipeptidase [Alphaproteobacteria bacterium]OJV13669.1 MAG: hypothetical protein BGO27_00660 [Alphaproteobacteria bacterium 33-17]